MTGKQKRYLRSLAHPLKPVVNFGKHGISNELKSEIVFHLHDHELIKCKVLGNCPLSKEECVKEISKMKSIEIVQIIGKTIIIFSRNTKNPKIKFP